MTHLQAFSAILVAFAQTPTKPQPIDDNATLVEVVRNLAGQQLYQTYQNLDSLTELRFFGTHEAGELAHTLTSCVDSANEAERQLARVAGLKGLSKADAAEVARLRKVAELLRDQGKLLQTYWDTGVVDYWKKSEVARKEAYKELEDILELKKGIAPPPREPGKKK